MNAVFLQRAAQLVGYRLGEQTQLLLERALARAAQVLGVPAEEAARRVLGLEPTAYRAFADAVAIHETYFFRHPEHFELIQRLAQAAANQGRPFRSAWSVGCATGEEAWSLLLSLWPHARELRVAGSDLSAEALAVARGGRYPARVFREGTPRAHFGLSFGGQHCELSTALKERASFSLLNLATDPIRPPAPLPAEVDVIFCRNVLVYLSADVARRVFSGLASCLSPDGVLVVGAVEVPPDAGEWLQPWDEVPGAFRRSPARTPAQPRPKPVPKKVDDGVAAQLANARRLADEGRLDEALAAAARAGDAPPALYLSASIQLERGNLTRASALLNRLLLSQPDSIPAHLSLAMVALRKGDTRSLQRHRERVRLLLEGRPDEEELGMEGMRAAWARQVLSHLSPEAGA